MIVLYLKGNNQFLQAIKGFPEIEERDNKLYFKGGKVILNDLTRAGYKEYPDQPIEIPTDWDEKTDSVIELPVTLAELGLRDFTSDELLEKGVTLKSLANEVKSIKERLFKIEGDRISK